MKCRKRNRSSLNSRQLLLLSLAVSCAPAAWADGQIQKSYYLQPISKSTSSADREAEATRPASGQSLIPRRLPKPAGPATTESRDAVMGLPIATPQPIAVVHPVVATSSLDALQPPETNLFVESDHVRAPLSALHPDVTVTPIEIAAKRLAQLRREKQQHRATPGTRWLQSVTTDSCRERSEQHLEDAFREYRVGAWSSAEASAWKALELMATGIDIASQDRNSGNKLESASETLRSARTAIDEAREFLSGGASIDQERLDAIAASHRTAHGSQLFTGGMSSTEAADAYLDFARARLAELAEVNVVAAQTMDLLAAIELGRNQQDRLPEETALCFRRAALQGQPDNSSLAGRLGMQLADMGLDREAAFTLQLAMELAPNEDVVRVLANVLERNGEHDAATRLTSRLQTTDGSAVSSADSTTVVELSPQEFAAISPPLNVVQPQWTAASQPTSATGTFAPNNHPADLSTNTLPASIYPASIHPASAPSAPGTPANLAGFRRPSTAAPQPATQSNAQQVPASSPVKRLMSKMRFW